MICNINLNYTFYYTFVFNTLETIFGNSDGFAVKCAVFHVQSYLAK